MEALECIKTRRSVRRFTEEPVTPEQVAEVVAAAAYAPSWKNTQIARYILVEDAQKRRKSPAIVCWISPITPTRFPMPPHWLR